MPQGNGVKRLQIHDGLTSKLSADFLGVLVIFRADKLSTLNQRKSTLGTAASDRVVGTPPHLPQSQDLLQPKPALSTRLRNS